MRMITSADQLTREDLKKIKNIIERFSVVRRASQLWADINRDARSLPDSFHLQVDERTGFASGSYMHFDALEERQNTLLKSILTRITEEIGPIERVS